MTSEKDAWERLITLQKLPPDSVFSPSRAKDGFYGAHLKVTLDQLDQQGAKTRDGAEKVFRAATPHPDPPHPPQTPQDQATKARQTILDLNALAVALVESSPEAPLWELRAMLRSQCKGVEAAAITAALKAATNSDNGSADGYGPGDALPDLETAWLLPDLIPAGDLTMLVAAPKASKTRFYLGLLAAMVRGDSCLGHQLPPIPPTLLIGTDMPRSLWRNYLVKSGLSTTGQVPAFMHKLFTLDRPLLLDSEGFRMIRTQCQANPGMLVIVDSLRSCSRSLGIDENSAEASDLLYQLGEVVTGAGGTCLVVHHAPKSIIRDGSVGVAAIRGSSAIGGVPSQVLSLHHLTKQKDGYPVALKDDPRRRLFAEGRFSVPLDLLVASNAQMQWELHGDYSDYEKEQAAEKDAKRQTEGQGKLLELIQADGPVEVKQAAEVLGVDARTIREQAKALETRGQIKRQPNGKGFLLVVADADDAEDPDAPPQGQIQLMVPPCPVAVGSAWDIPADWQRKE